MSDKPTKLSADEWKALAFRQDARIQRMGALLHEVLPSVDTGDEEGRALHLRITKELEGKR